LTNRLAFDASSITEVTAFILERETPSLRSARADIPEPLELIIQRCLAKSPAQRFQNVGELAIALAPFAPPRARVLIERCCSILQGAGMTRAGLDKYRSPPPPAPDSALAGPISAEALSTATVEASIRFVPSTSKSWPLALAALLLVAAGAAGMLVRNGVNDEASPTLTPLAAPAAQPSAEPPMTALPTPSAPATPAPPAPDKPAPTAEAANTAEASGGAAGAKPAPDEAPAVDAKPPLDAPSDPSADGSPTPSAASPSAPTAASPEPSGAAQPRVETPKPKPVQAAPPRRRVVPPAPKPKPAPSARSVPAPQEEPDIGF
jgi:serine/threonine-protein kinase